MPLMHSKSKKAFSKNVGTEMHAGKPQKQALAIAYDVQRKARKKKKMAEGGPTPEPSPSPKSDPLTPVRKYVNTHTDGGPKQYAKGGNVNDKEMLTKNRHSKDNGQDLWTDRPDIAQSQNRPKSQPIKHPKMVPSDAFSTRLYDQEGNLVGHMRPADPETQPDPNYNEQSSNRQGSEVHDMEDEHSTHRKPYAKGGEIEPSDKKHHMDGDYEDDLLDLPPSEDEGSMMAHDEDEEEQDKSGHPIRDMEREHNNGRKPYARGGHVSPEHEEEMEHDDSIAAAIMAKKARERGVDGAMSDSDIDEMIRLYDGGEVLESEHMEEPNNEDQMSFEALKKENYNSSDLDINNPEDSAEHGDSEETDEENDHDEDMISSIRRRMKSKQLPQR